MAELKISLDDAQVETLRGALRKPPSSIWSSDNLLRVVQILAVVIGGCWVLVQFLLYQREEIALRRDDLAHAVELKRLEERLSNLKLERSAHEVDSLKTYRFAETGDLTTHEIEAVGDGTSIFEVVFSSTVENTSDAPFEVSLWILDSYIGSVSEKLLGRNSFVEAVGFPPDRWNPGSGGAGAVEWVRLRSRAGVFPDALDDIGDPWKYVAGEAGLVPGSGPVGTLKPAQSYIYQEVFLVKAPADAYVSFVMSYCFERCRENDDLFNRKRYAKLRRSQQSEAARPPAALPTSEEE